MSNINWPKAYKYTKLMRNVRNEIKQIIKSIYWTILQKWKLSPTAWLMSQTHLKTYFNAKKIPNPRIFFIGYAKNFTFPPPYS